MAGIWWGKSQWGGVRASGDKFKTKTGVNKTHPPTSPPHFLHPPHTLVRRLQ